MKFIKLLFVLATFLALARPAQAFRRRRIKRVDEIRHLLSSISNVITHNIQCKRVNRRLLEIRVKKWLRFELQLPYPNSSTDFEENGINNRHNFTEHSFQPYRASPSLDQIPCRSSIPSLANSPSNYDFKAKSKGLIEETKEKTEKPCNKKHNKRMELIQQLFSKIANARNKIQNIGTIYDKEICESLAALSSCFWKSNVRNLIERRNRQMNEATNTPT